MKRTKIILASFFCLSFFCNWHPYDYSFTLKEKGIYGSAKTIFQRGYDFSRETVVVQHYNTIGQLTEIRFFYDQMIFDSVDFHSPETLDDTFQPLDSALYTIPKYSDYKGLDTLMMKFSHRFCFEYYSSGKLKTKTGFGTKNEIFQLTNYHYNLKDSLVQETFFSLNSEDKLTKYSRSYYKYKSSETYRKKMHKSIVYSPKKIDNSFVLEYNIKNDTIIQIFQKLNNDRTIFSLIEYLENCVITNGFEVYYTDTVLKRKEYKYYNEFLLKKHILEEYLDKNLTNRTETLYAYDNLGILVSTVRTDYSIYSDYETKSLTYYDSINNPYLYITNKDTTLISYEYDDYRNWIKSSVTHRGEKIITNRKIYYY
jgi:hypothetical protein